jgi:4-carboxymuconolactone decarboxylase
MTDDQEIVYEFGRELNDNHGVTDRTYARAVTRFGEHGVMDLVGVNGFYSLISMALNVGRTPLPPGVAPALKPTPR